MFPPDFPTARERFRTAARGFGWAVESHPIAARGPAGEELTLDIAAHGPGDPSKTLIVSSGVHGVEAPFGSAVQLALLERWQSAPPVRCLLVHAVNPWGFAHRRRWNEDNIDLNRNFLVGEEKYAGSPEGYAELDSLLNPPHPPRRFDTFLLRAAWLKLCRGLAELKQAIAVGQYDHPKALFFGGSGPAESVRILGEHWERWLGGATDVVHLDFHTGLGKWGTHKLLLDKTTSPAESEWWNEWFGRGRVQRWDPKGVAYDARGGFGPWCHFRRGQRRYLFACAEFGTYGPTPVVAALRAENMAHHWGTPTDPGTERAKRRLVEVFCPADAGWRAKAVAAGCELAERAAASLGVRTSAELPDPTH